MEFSLVFSEVYEEKSSFFAQMRLYRPILFPFTIKRRVCERERERECCAGPVITNGSQFTLKRIIGRLAPSPPLPTRLPLSQHTQHTINATGHRYLRLTRPVMIAPHYTPKTELKAKADSL
jgi:hypothetical protein